MTENSLFSKLNLTVCSLSYPLALREIHELMFFLFSPVSFHHFLFVNISMKKCVDFLLLSEDALVSFEGLCSVGSRYLRTPNKKTHPLLFLTLQLNHNKLLLFLLSYTYQNYFYLINARKVRENFFFVPFFVFRHLYTFS